MQNLLDQRVFVLDPERFEMFAAALDRAPSPHPKLKALFAKKAPWERGAEGKRLTYRQPH